MILEEKKIDSEEIFDGVIIKVFKDTVTLPNGKTAIREVMRHPGAVCVVAVDDEDNVVVEKQFRYPFRKVMTEIPAGKMDAGESPLAAAKRELSEETGIEAERWHYLGEYYPSVAISDEVIHMFAAFDLTICDAHTDEGEFLMVEKLPLSELTDMILRGEITDGKTQTAVLKVVSLFYKN